MFLSIITVVYNGENTIERTIQSILKQGFKDYEYIIQDGESNDHTLDIAKSYENKFEGRLNIYSEKDNGIYDAMNKGIAHAKGEYIWLVNADDYITDNSLQMFYDFCKSTGFKEAVISSRMNLVDADTLQLKSTSSSSSIESYVKSCSKLKMGICHPASIIHRIIYKTVGVFDDRYYISADVDFCLRCYRANVPVIFTDLVLTNMTDGGISNQLPIKKCMHDCNLRTSKFCKNWFHRMQYTVWYFSRLLIVKQIGYRTK